jgi:DNA invertase Pin-like site-specific DNA recombinase
MAQDLTAQRQALAALGVPADRVYLDKGLTGTSRVRPGLDQAIADRREGDTLTVTKLDRLARSVPDALDILSGLPARGARFRPPSLRLRRSPDRAEKRCGNTR